MKYFLLFLSLMVAIIVESTLMQLPCVLLVLFIIAIMYRSEWIFIIGLLTGFFLDGVTFRPFGSSSLFFLLFLFLVFLYEKKFELRTIWFVLFMSSFGSVIYLLVFGHAALLTQTIWSAGIGSLLFFSFSFLQPMPGKDTLTTWKK